MSRVLVLLLLSASLIGGLAAGTSPAVAAAETSSADLVDDLRLLQILNAAGISRGQAKQMEPLAADGRTALRQVEQESRAATDRLHGELQAARSRLLQGTGTDDPVFEQVRLAREAGEEIRKRRTEALVTGLSGRLQRIVNGIQAERLRELMAAGAGQPWPPETLYVPQRSAAKRDEDLERMVLDLERLRASAGTPDAETQLQRFLRGLVRDAEPPSPEHRSRLAAAQSLARQALSLPPAAFDRRKLELGAASDRLLQAAMESDRLTRAYGTSDVYRWFVTHVLLNPRAAVVLREKAARFAPMSNDQ